MVPLFYQIFENGAAIIPAIQLHLLILLKAQFTLARVTSGPVTQPGHDFKFNLAYLLSLTLL